MSLKSFQYVQSGSGGGSGTVTSVGGTGTVSGLTLSGTVTGSGNLTLGGTLSLSMHNASFFYYPNGPQPGVKDKIFELPDKFRADAIVAYSHRFKHFTLRTQLNISNVFNHYNVVITPNPVLGYAGPNDATFDGMPRHYSLTNTLSF